MSDRLDDAAAAALFRLAHEPNEHMGALYADGGGYARSATITRGGKGEVRGTLSVPTGALRALFHNHPELGHDAERALFSPDDKAQAKRLKVPSYISAGERVRRYDPRTNKSEDVLAEFPIAEWRSHLMQSILGRSPDDPRGVLR
jgi:hypothetical protein